MAHTIYSQINSTGRIVQDKSEVYGTFFTCGHSTPPARAAGADCPVSGIHRPKYRVSELSSSLHRLFSGW